MKGLVFDLLSQFDETIEAKWYDTKQLFLKQINSLPELENNQNSKFSGFNASGNFRKRTNSGVNEARKSEGFKMNFKRKIFENNYTENPNKKIKFDD